MFRKNLKLFLCVACMAACLCIPGVAFAESNIAQIQAPEVFSKENLAEVDALKNAVKAHNDEISTREVYGTKVLEVPLYKQTNSYYCGPASARMTLKYLGVSVTQGNLATQMGTTTTNGTYVYKIQDCLNNHLGGTKYKYVLNSQIAFGEGLTYSIDKGRPVICHVMTGTLPNYASTGHNTGHYLVARGYYYKAVGSTGTDIVYYNDPNNDSAFYGKYECSWSKMRNAILNNASYYIMSV